MNDRVWQIEVSTHEGEWRALSHGLDSLMMQLAKAQGIRTRLDHMSFVSNFAVRVYNTDGTGRFLLV